MEYINGLEVLSIVGEYCALPKTEEKERIDNQYLNDEIDKREFFEMASAYLKNAKSTDAVIAGIDKISAK